MKGCSSIYKGPNGNPGAEALISVVAYELFEAFTDPNFNAVFDSAGCENADKVCFFSLPVLCLVIW